MFFYTLYSVRTITLQLLFESTTCRKLSDADGKVVPSFQSRILKTFLDLSKITCCDLQASAIPCIAAGVLGPMIKFIQKAFGTLPVNYFVCCS